MIRFIDEEGLISPRGEHIHADVAITTFSTFIFDTLLKRTGAKQAGVMYGSVDIPLYTFTDDGKTIVVYHTPVGAPAAVSALEEILACGVKKVIAFGICGALTEASPHLFVVPTRAYRDEGTSYHYMPASEYVEIKNADKVKSVLESAGIKTLVGGAWTTDGFYRETRTRLNEMVEAGCVAVDMESAALQACSNFRGTEFYTFFITADSLSGEQWEPNTILDLKATDSTHVAVAAAVRLALLL
ncbi:MAG: nucleoside phosphorylase [Clostridiales bacterium]|nr:nucleoside phosphorylase [Clostridiales bacterium]